VRWRRMCPGQWGIELAWGWVRSRVMRGRPHGDFFFFVSNVPACVVRKPFVSLGTHATLAARMARQQW